MREFTAPAPPAPVFDVVLYPHRSLDRHGFVLLMTAIALVSGLVGAGFALIGAWPVTGFFGLDVLLLYLAFRWSYRAGRLAEFIRLDPDALVVRRVDPRGRSQEWRLSPHWVRIELDEQRPSGGALRLCAHGQELAVGSFLSPPERAELAASLRRALGARQRPA
jgi:uncharacterized membrane protein